MSDIQVARVEAAVKAIEKIPHIVWNSPTRYDAMVLAEAAIAAADAVVTVEMIAEVLDSAYPYTVKHGGLRPAAEAVLALLRGGEGRCRDCSRPAPARDLLCRNCLAKSEVGG